MKKEIIYDLIIWIDCNLEKKLTLFSISSKSGYSASHLQHSFKKHTGITIFEYIRIRKLFLISQEIIKSNDKIIIIAEKYHFLSFSHFCKIFHIYFGISPAEYRIIKDRTIFDTYFLKRMPCLPSLEMIE